MQKTGKNDVQNPLDVLLWLIASPIRKQAIGFAHNKLKLLQCWRQGMN